MGRYVARRVLQFIPVLLGALFLLHYMTSLGIQFNGDPARAYFGDRTPSAVQLEQLQRAWGVDDPCLSQPGNPCLTLFAERLGVARFFDDDAPRGYLQGSFGTDFRGREITELLGQRAPITLRLTLLAILIEVAIGIFAGVLAGLRRGRFFDYVVKISTVMIVSIPVFVIGLLLQWNVGLELGNWVRTQAWVPAFIGNMFNVAYRDAHPWASLVLPALVLASASLAFIARLTRTSMVENIRADYVRTAVAKGLTNRRVFGVHTLRNSLIPAVTYIGIDIGALMGGAVITEGIFNVPGIGRQVIRSIAANEGPIIIGIVTILVVVYMVTSLLVDLLYAVLDPRIRYE